MAEKGTAPKRKIPKWLIAASVSAVLIALAATYAYVSDPALRKPTEVIVTGKVQFSGANLEKITFTNTACGTKNVAEILSTEAPGKYEIILKNSYSYNVSITWNSGGNVSNQTDMKQLVLDTFEKSIVRDWAIQP